MKQDKIWQRLIRERGGRERGREICSDRQEERERKREGKDDQKVV